MKIKNIAPILFLFLSIQSFSQKSDYKWIKKEETDNAYLDSIKKTFVKDDLASCVDSLWLNELAGLDIYSDVSGELNTINTDKNIDKELPTELLKARLKAMDEKSPFHIDYNQSLENLIKSFLKNRKKSFGRQMALSEYYFPIFEEALSKQNVPLEIKYLAVVESSLNPKAVSRVGATGLWQFMYETGKQYNLNIDSYVDERSDPLKSSSAASQYMTNMYAIFGDWDLVLASYNSGPGNVAKAIRRSGGQQNFWNIRKYLPQETQGYVPAFLATMYIYEYHKEHGIVADRALIKHFETDTIMIRKEISFKEISDLIDIPVAQLRLLNPSYKLDVVPHYGDKDHYLRLPKDKIAVFTSNEKQIYAYVQHEDDLREKFLFSPTKAYLAKTGDSSSTTRYSTQSSTKYYKVKKGDSLNAIADKYDVSVADIKKWNALRSNSLAYGKSLKIRVSESVAIKETTPSKAKISPTELASNNSKIAASESKKDTLISSAAAYYVVQKGDNLSNIAKKYSVSIDDLKNWNHLSDNSIHLGASLQVGVNEEMAKEEIASAPVREIENVEYVVKKGDNLGNISKKYGSTVEDLKLWNNLQDNNIALGSSLIVAKNEVIPEIETPPTNAFTTKKESIAYAAKNSTKDYLVQKGDSLFSIAKKHPGVTVSDIQKWNDIKSEDLKPGMKLKINNSKI
jgi:membrane-bound lytic murein transglycosylase D